MLHVNNIGQDTAVQAKPGLKHAPAKHINDGLSLRRYRVTNFRSVVDSGYLELDHVTALIGVNESARPTFCCRCGS